MEDYFAVSLMHGDKYRHNRDNYGLFVQRSGCLVKMPPHNHAYLSYEGKKKSSFVTSTVGGGGVSWRFDE